MWHQQTKRPIPISSSSSGRTIAAQSRSKRPAAVSVKTIDVHWNNENRENRKKKKEKGKRKIQNNTPSGRGHEQKQLSRVKLHRWRVNSIRVALDHVHMREVDSNRVYHWKNSPISFNINKREGGDYPLIRFHLFFFLYNAPFSRSFFSNIPLAIGLLVETVIDC